MWAYQGSPTCRKCQDCERPYTTSPVARLPSEKLQVQRPVVQAKALLLPHRGCWLSLCITNALIGVADTKDSISFFQGFGLVAWRSSCPSEWVIFWVQDYFYYCCIRTVAVVRSASSVTKERGVNSVNPCFLLAIQNWWYKRVTTVEFAYANTHY